VKLLLDTCVWAGAAEALRAAGHDARWVGESGADPGDEAIMGMAYAEDRVLVTLDKDFGELAVVYRKPHCGIVRLVGLSARRQGAYCSILLERFGHELTRGAIVTATADRVRIRAAPRADPEHGNLEGD
jgi:predicted nuclease of predicted toxin-antitoxin system